MKQYKRTLTCRCGNTHEAIAPEGSRDFGYFWDCERCGNKVVWNVDEAFNENKVKQLGITGM